MFFFPHLQQNYIYFFTFFLGGGRKQSQISSECLIWGEGYVLVMFYCSSQGTVFQLPLKTRVWFTQAVWAKRPCYVFVTSRLRKHQWFMLIETKGCSINVIHFRSQTWSLIFNTLKTLICMSCSLTAGCPRTLQIRTFSIYSLSDGAYMKCFSLLQYQSTKDWV